MDEVVTTGAISCPKFQSDRHHQQTNTSFYRPDAFPVAQPTVSYHWREDGVCVYQWHYFDITIHHSQCVQRVWYMPETVTCWIHHLGSLLSVCIIWLRASWLILLFFFSVELIHYLTEQVRSAEVWGRCQWHTVLQLHCSSAANDDQLFEALVSFTAVYWLERLVSEITYYVSHHTFLTFINYPPCYVVRSYRYCDEFVVVCVCVCVGLYLCMCVCLYVSLSLCVCVCVGGLSPKSRWRPFTIANIYPWWLCSTTVANSIWRECAFRLVNPLIDGLAVLVCLCLTVHLPHVYNVLWNCKLLSSIITGLSQIPALPVIDYDVCVTCDWCWYL